MIFRIKYPALAIMAAMMLLSCNREELVPDVPHGPEKVITSVIHYRASAGESVNTKSSLNGNNQYVFEAGDALYVVDSETNGNQLYGVMVLVAGAGDPIGYFEGDLMCFGTFVPGANTGLSATLVSSGDKIHICLDGKITGTSYPSSGDYAYAADFPEAIRCFSDFKAQSTFGARVFSLEQNSSFLVFSVTFSEDEVATINNATTIKAAITNDSSPLRTGPVGVSEVGFSTQANFVAAFPANTALSDAAVSFTLTDGTTSVGSADAISNATLQANSYYDISRSHVSLEYFTIQAKEEGTTRVTFSFTFADCGVQYRKQGDTDFDDYDGSAIELTQGQYVQFRGKGTSYKGVLVTENEIESNTKWLFTSQDNKVCYIYGNIMSLVCDNNYNPKSVLGTDAFRYAFRGATWIDIPAGRPLRLTASSLGQYCYNQMFWGCTSLTRPPELQTTLSADIPRYAYSYMFKDCISLLSAPNLQEGRVVGESGYEAMFQGCTSLITVPATISGTSGSKACQYMFDGCSTLANAPVPTSLTVGSSGYRYMFRNCTSLVSAPTLSATTLGANCYQEMFKGCTSLVNGPRELPATTLTSYCYKDMFNGCLSLATVPTELPATCPDSPSPTECYRSMFIDCISLNRAPVIRLISIGQDSCREMFKGCTALVTAYGPEYANSVGIRGCYQMFANCGELATTPSELKSETLALSSYYQMYFNCTKITAAPDIKATIVDITSCYQMFYGCTRLRTAPPALDVATVSKQAFKGMFQSCGSLASAPSFTGMTSVGEEGCMNMFNGCTNLSVAPELPAETLDKSAYQAMFQNSGITSVPELPATTLAEKCYQSMFQSCKYLEGPAVLPAPTLVANCYNNMFNGASILNSVVCLATDHSATDCTKDWLKSVAATGTFVRPAGVSWTTGSTSGIPTGWTPQDSGIDPIFPDDGPFNPEEDL